jgi:hypothetical protein
MSSKIENLKSKIAALLAKAERTDNEHERDAFNAKAEKLMLAYGIEAAELEAAGEVKPEEIVQVFRGYIGGYALLMPEFVYLVSQAMGGLRVIQSNGIKGSRGVWLIGHESDVDTAWTIIDSLEKQAHLAMKRWVRQQNADPSSIYRLIPGPEKFKSRREYILGFALGAGKRIDEEKRDVESTASTGAALVLVSKTDRVNQYMDDQHSNLKPAKDRRQQGVTGRGAGYRDGQQANVGTTALPAQPKAVQ